MVGPAGRAGNVGQGRPQVLCGKQAGFAALLTALSSQFWPFLSTYKNSVQVWACFPFGSAGSPRAEAAPIRRVGMRARVLRGGRGKLTLFCEIRHLHFQTGWQAE